MEATKGLDPLPTSPTFSSTASSDDHSISHSTLVLRHANIFCLRLMKLSLLLPGMLFPGLFKWSVLLIFQVSDQTITSSETSLSLVFKVFYPSTVLHITWFLLEPYTIWSYIYILVHLCTFVSFILLLSPRAVVLKLICLQKFTLLEVIKNPKTFCVCELYLLFSSTRN